MALFGVESIGRSTLLSLASKSTAEAVPYNNIDDRIVMIMKMRPIKSLVILWISLSSLLSRAVNSLASSTGFIRLIELRISHIARIVQEATSPPFRKGGI